MAAIAGLSVEGLYTHFATADADNLTATRQQLADFLDVVGRLRAAGIAPAVLHAANSAATLALPAAHLDQVRVGAALYGLHTTAARDAAASVQLNGERWHASGAPSLASALRPVLTLKTRVIRLRHVPAGTPVSYGGTYHTPQATCLATLAAGYGDGLSVALSNRGAVLLGGRLCPIVGRVCMDQLVVDCRDGRGIQEGAAAVLIGQQGAASITAEDVAAASDSTNYEVVTRLLARVPRFYHRSHAPTGAFTHPTAPRCLSLHSPRSPMPSIAAQAAIQTGRGATNGAGFRLPLGVNSRLYLLNLRRLRSCAIAAGTGSAPRWAMMIAGHNGRPADQERQRQRLAQEDDAQCHTQRRDEVLEIGHPCHREDAEGVEPKAEVERRTGQPHV